MYIHPYINVKGRIIHNDMNWKHCKHLLTGEWITKLWNPYFTFLNLPWDSVSTDKSVRPEILDLYTFWACVRILPLNMLIL